MNYSFCFYHRTNHFQPQLEHGFGLIRDARFEQPRPDRPKFLLQGNDNWPSTAEVACHVEQSEQHALRTGAQEIIKITATALAIVNRSHVTIANLWDRRLNGICPRH